MSSNLTKYNLNKYNLTKEYLERLYLKENKTLKKIAEEVGCHWETIRVWCHKFGIPLRNPREPNFIRYIQKREAAKRKLPIRKDYIYNRYIKQGWSLKRIASECKCNWTTIERRCVEFGIQLRKSHKSTQARLKYFLNKDRYADSKTLKTAMIVIFGHKCMLCGYDKVLDVHHINRVKNGHYVSSSLLLCPNHHREVHLGIIPKKKIDSIVKHNQEKVRHSK